jgi:hypothetical protein
MTPASFRNWWACGFTGNPQQAWLARDAAGAAGSYLLELPDRDKARTASSCCASRPAGGRAGLIDVRRILTVGPDLPGRLTRLQAQAAAAAGGYTLISWRGPVPAEHLTAVAAVVSAISDAPRDDAIEPGSWDADRVRQIGEWTAEYGLQQFSVAARHDSSGELAALSQALLEPGTPGWAFQQITAVSRPHRGHRLGLLVKTALHQRLLAADPAIRQVMTVNAAANEHMIAINELMGYRAASRFQSWELDLAG